ncbi:hypothetical protein ABEY43_11440 [Priestia megaterium]|uniref:hypothetical protein n=1 Tax=Priestia megaterium TaxID=1404 RepID=UPI002E1D550C|nr:hypothetical protein [Priestia megaterium]
MSFLLSLLPFSFLKKFRFPSGREVNEDKMFDKTNVEMLQQRVKLVSLALVVSYPIYIYIYIGFSLLQHAGTSQFRHTLIGIHFTSLALSSLYLFFYYVSKRKERFANYLSTMIYGYIFYYVFAAALSTINSQLFTGRVDVYMMLLISTAVLCPMKLKHLCIIFIPNHLFLRLITICTGFFFSYFKADQYNCSSCYRFTYFIHSLYIPSQRIYESFTAKRKRT